jgi:hypothetical protein
MRSLRLLPVVFTLLASAAPPLFAQSQAQDAPPVDIANLLKELHHIRDVQTTQSKQTRQTVLQQVNAAAASADRATAMWEEAVRAVQFDGAPKENAAFRDWKEKDGEALASPLGRNAARLFFLYLGLTIQRDGNVPVKDLLPQIVAYTKELAADQAGADALDDSIKHDKENPVNNKPRPMLHKASDDQVRKMHDQILKRPLASSPVVQWMKLADFVNPEKWEKQPGNLDGIYTQIILPEMRAERDPRIVDYWDYKLKQEGEAAVKTKLAFDLDKFTTLRRPTLLWSRAEDMLAVGQKNRGIGEMFTLIRTFPQHPEAAGWITELEGVLAPPPPAAPASAADASSSAALPGSAQPAPGVVK